MFMILWLLILSSILSSARLYFGRGALMAKALGTTPEEEHRPGLAPLARGRDKFIINHRIDADVQLICRSANKGTSWTAIHRYRTSGGDRVDQGLPSTRF